jgi:bla regulator protein blaR1
MSWLVLACLNNGIFVIPFALLAWGIGRYSRWPALAHVLWVLVLIKLVTPPIISLPLGWSYDLEQGLAQLLAAPPEAGLYGASLYGPGQLSSPATGIAAGHPLTGVHVLVGLALAAWAVGCVVQGGVVLAQTWRFRTFLRRAGRSDALLQERANRLASSLALAAAPHVVVVQGVVSPLLWGLGRRTCLVFPERLAGRLTSQQIDALLLHELAHYCRGDQWVRLLELFARLAYWWNPLVAWACQEIELVEEQCCDAFVVERLQNTRESYATALLATLDFLGERMSPSPPTACGLGEVPLLRLRLKQIMQEEPRAGAASPRWGVVLLAGLLLVPLAPAIFAPAPPADSGLQSPDFTGNLRLARYVGDSPDGRFRVEMVPGRGTTLIQRETGWRIDLNQQQLGCVAFAPDCTTFVTGHDDGLVRQWDCQTGNMVHSYRGDVGPIRSVAYAPDGLRLAAGSADGVVIVWSSIRPEELVRHNRQTSSVSCVRWSPLGERLAILCGEQHLKQPGRLQVWRVDDDQVLSDEPLLESAGAMTWLSDDALLIAAWSGQGTVRNLRGQFPDLQISLRQELILTAAFSSEVRLVPVWAGERLAAGAGL